VETISLAEAQRRKGRLRTPEFSLRSLRFFASLRETALPQQLALKHFNLRLTYPSLSATNKSQVLHCVRFRMWRIFKPANEHEQRRRRFVTSPADISVNASIFHRLDRSANGAKYESLGHRPR